MCFNEKFNDNFHPCWNKIASILNNLKKYKYLVWIDCDAIITNHDKRIEDIINMDDSKDMHICNDIVKDKLHYATPMHMNDDLFTILAYINNPVNIITNDTFKDHSIDDNYLRFHINDVLIKYKNEKGVITFEPFNTYTQCVQVVQNCVYIPCKNGFIEIQY